MPIFELRDGGLSAVSPTSFGAESIYERRDIQKILCENIQVLGERLLVISEEFGGWIDSSRRVDILCLDSEANLVVVEIKRTEDGGHMELQALRYAAMISAMTFDQLVDVYARHRDKFSPDTDAARAAILEFLGWDAADEEQVVADTRIILAAADFSKELTTSVMWLNDRGIDIRCVRLKPYRMDAGPILLDIAQVIPLPEASNFQTQIGVKRQAERKGRSERHELRYRFWEGLIEHVKLTGGIHANRSPTKDNWLSGGIGRAGFQINYVVRENEAQVELFIGLGAGQAARNTQAFLSLYDQKSAIEKDFGEELMWEELPARDGCRIRFPMLGGYRSPDDEWPEIHARMAMAMKQFEHALRQRVQALQVG